MGRFEDAIAAIDLANSADPNHLFLGGESKPKEAAHSEMLTAWVRRLRPDAPEPLLLAARAQHLRRWEIPRASYPEGRHGYLRWRTALYAFHAEKAAEVLRSCSYAEGEIERVTTLVAKRAPANDRDAAALEDGLCLVFLETQLAELNDRIPDDKLVEILQKTWRKVSPAGRAAALSLDLPEPQRSLLARAVGAN